MVTVELSIGEINILLRALKALDLPSKRYHIEGMVLREKLEKAKER